MTDALSLSERSIAAIGLDQLLSAWWFNYDEWNDELLRGLIDDDMRFTCRTDSGETDYEEFVRIDVTGADEVMKWQCEHRQLSPYPLRHNSSNVHITAMSRGVVEFASYIFVTKIVDGRPLSLSSGTACGAANIAGSDALLQRLDVILDTTDSQPLGKRAVVTRQPVPPGA